MRSKPGIRRLIGGGERGAAALRESVKAANPHRDTHTGQQTCQERFALRHIRLRQLLARTFDLKAVADDEFEPGSAITPAKWRMGGLHVW